MLCGIHCPSSPSSNHHPRFLRSFRSHKNLRQDHLGSTSTSSSRSQEMHHHRYQPSGASASSPARPSLDSSPRPSTSSRSDVSIDWDPLRLHPPSLAPGPVPPLQDAFSGETSRASRRYHHHHQPPHELRHTRSSHNLRHQTRLSPPPPLSHRPLHGSFPSSSPSHSTVIYDGFDFGLGNAAAATAAHHQATAAAAAKACCTAPTPRSITTTAGVMTAPHRRDPSPAPSDASSECSLALSGGGGGRNATSPSLGGRGGGSSGDDDDGAMGLYMRGLAPAPGPRPRPRPRPRPGWEGSEVEDFILRGGWKRRGIVFVDEDGLEGEEEAFEI
ncbi:uncharacterized protein THITE_153186 [Thermothielavioides terrestris NRRL 8126]|uniref:Uncharacterized protein n=1 Tax=Thermothielavioides terrestris (strain ATCC 38088 / NRRL 8126) TaxID=578455 RepID=G2R541_THETT|nr:uncharacterized protein THITE_153186 [Thermothielavioides terrestris NRRL 8126]AEO65318.1 hypothetical protein THITE_153186 [Thermothielavioides terrestris NRRL 8126]